MRFHATIDLARGRRHRSRFAIQRRGFSFGHEPFADPIDRIHVHAQLFGDLRTRQPAPGTVAIAQQKD
jgi:hypothetical protein